MRIFRCGVLAFVLLSLPALVLAAGKHGDMPDRVPDPYSTFILGNVTGAFPDHDAPVPMSLSTSAGVSYTYNQVTWTASDLTLTDVTLGSEAAATGGSILWSFVDANTVQIEILWGSDQTIGTGPLAVLHFDVGCYGYGASTAVDFVASDPLNYYNSTGISYWPLRDGGYVSTASPSYTFFYSLTTFAVPGQQDVAITADYYTTIPRRLTHADVTYDDGYLSFTSVETHPDFAALGGSVSLASTGAGTFSVDITGPFLEAPEEQRLFIAHYSLTDAETHSGSVASYTGTQEDPCGQPWAPATGGAYMHVTHTATVAALGSNQYQSAAYYDVPITMHSNAPVNDYRLFVRFDDANLDFQNVVGVGGFTPPSAAPDGGDPSLIQVNASLGTDYDVTSTQTVFKLRFEPSSTPAVGTEFDFDFDTGADEVVYDTELGPESYADLTLVGGTVTIIANPGGGGGGGGCCPTLFVWNGSGFQLENTILAACDEAKVEDDIVEFYKIDGRAKANNGEIRMQLREDAGAHSEFRDFELLAVDHPKDHKIYVTPEGAIMVPDQPMSIIWARDNTGRDITDLISTPDGQVYSAPRTGWFDVSFGKVVDSGGDDKYAEVHDAAVKNKAPRGQHAQGLDVKRTVTISVRTAQGWKTLSSSDARHVQVRQATVIDPSVVADGEELVLRYSWTGSYWTDAVEFSYTAEYDGEVASLALSDVVHSEDGSVTNRLAGLGGASMVTLEQGEVIDLFFDAGALDELSEDTQRDYILVSTGKYSYETTESGAGPLTFSLDDNTPNPFNPSTSIRYSLARSAHVRLTIHDVSGALVRTLVNEQQSAGRRSVEWNGMSDNGTPMASGVYFYRLSAGDYVSSKKMILLK